MARGWESKSIESQQDLARAEQDRPRAALSDEQKKIQQQREGLLLSRARVAKQLESSTSDRYSQTLRQALDDLDQKIAALTNP